MTEHCSFQCLSLHVTLITSYNNYQLPATEQWLINVLGQVYVVCNRYLQARYLKN